MDRVALFRSISLFEGFSAGDLLELANSATERSFRAGQIIFHQGDRGTQMYVIASGDVNIYLPGEHSQRVSLKDLGAGEYFGELALFDDEPRSASALATTDTVLLELTGQVLASYLQRRPAAANAILRTMAERLRQTNAMLSERAAKNVLEELDKQLTWGDHLADRVAAWNGSWGFILMLLALTGAWFVVNVRGARGQPFDPYPFVFYNLLLAILVSLQGPLIVMSQNRQTLKDRAQAETDYKVNLKNEVNIETLLRELAELRAELQALKSDKPKAS